MQRTINQQSPMQHEPDNALLQEVETLRAIYGEDNISFNPATSTSQATVTISLDGLTSLAPKSLTLTTRLPWSYPSIHPSKPILRSCCFTASQCEALVDEMMSVQTATEGEVCLYDWFQEMITIINDTKDIAKHSSAATVEQDKSGTQEFAIHHGEPLTDRNSVFQAHVASVSNISDIEQVLATLRGVKKKVESATHNTLAYRIRGRNDILQDVDDDGEKGAGKVALYVLQRFKVVNVVVIVSRWFGGIKLGPVRFRHIAKVTGDVLEAIQSKLSHEDAVIT